MLSLIFLSILFMLAHKMRWEIVHCPSIYFRPSNCIYFICNLTVQWYLFQQSIITTDVYNNGSCKDVVRTDNIKYSLQVFVNYFLIAYVILQSLSISVLSNAWPAILPDVAQAEVKAVREPYCKRKQI